MFKLKISLKRVQTFIFEVPRLKAMLGANALVGQTMRHELAKLVRGKGKRLAWPPGEAHEIPDDPLNGTADPDDPSALYAEGILARDGGHFIAVFETEDAAQGLLDLAEAKLAELLPGVLYDATIEPLPASPTVPEARREIKPREVQILDLPVLQVCQETGRGPASDSGESDGKVYWQGRSVSHRQDWGRKFYEGATKDIIGLMRPALYPDLERNWSKPDDLAQLAAGGYLALIHADGNGIGKRYKGWRETTSGGDAIGQEAHGEAFFHGMRVVVRRAVVDALAQTFTAPGGRRPYELLMLGGDDLLLICRADQALTFACNYAVELEKYNLADGPPLAVAIGVAIAQQSYPLHRLQELAESLASSAKRLYRALPPTGQTSVIDWQVVTQSWFAGVAEARQQSDRVDYRVNGQREALLLTGRPYPVLGDDGLEALLKASAGLDGKGGDDKAARSPLRSLRGACERGRLMGEMAFAGLPEGIQSELGWSGRKLWKDLDADGEAMYATRAIDIIDIREIARLGRKKND